MRISPSTDAMSARVALGCGCIEGSPPSVSGPDRWRGAGPLFTRETTAPPGGLPRRANPSRALATTPERAAAAGDLVEELDMPLTPRGVRSDAGGRAAALGCGVVGTVNERCDRVWRLVEQFA